MQLEALATNINCSVSLIMVALTNKTRLFEEDGGSNKDQTRGKIDILRRTEDAIY